MTVESQSVETGKTEYYTFPVGTTLFTAHGRAYAQEKFIAQKLNKKIGRYYCFVLQNNLTVRFPSGKYSTYHIGDEFSAALTHTDFAPKKNPPPLQKKLF